MAPLPATATGVLAIIHRFTVGGDQNVTTKLHFRYTGGPPSTAQMTALAADVKAAFTTALAAQLSSNITLNTVTVLDLANPVTPPGTWSGTQAGSRTGTSLPASVAVVTSYHIARRYRGGHPRGYWPLLAAADLASPGAFNTAGISSLQTSMGSYITAVKALTSGGVTIGNQCNVSYYSGGSWTTPTGGSKPRWRPTLRTPPTVDDITSVLVNVKPGSQRRRMRKA